MEVVNNKSRDKNMGISIYYLFKGSIGLFFDDFHKKLCKMVRP